MQKKIPDTERLEAWKRLIEQEDSEQIVIKGKSGVGKSTLLRYLKKLYHESAMLADGKSSVFEGTIEENILVGRKINIDLQACLNILFFESKILQNKDYIVSNDTLSAGQIQRIALLRDVISSDNKIVMLDEPTSALDEQTEEQVGYILENYCHKMRIKRLIIATHSRMLATHLKRAAIVYLSD
jgi:ABC-type bacteriocin/lantibiotic exporter with double-glycine peptidase domain